MNPTRKFDIGDRVITKDKTSGKVVGFCLHDAYWVEILQAEDGRKIDCLFSEEELELELENAEPNQV